MNVVGLITEYNPFHYGHKYHLEKSKSITNSSYSIAIMSGSFVQRGEPSFIDKWTKAKMAIDNGVDLVIELPFIFAIQSAELFAYGSVALLNSLNIIDYLVFGSELGNIQSLKEIAEVLVNEPSDYKNSLKYYLDRGYSFPQSRSNALEDYFNKYNNSFNIKEILKMSNNILAIEYLKALKVLDSPITPITLKRIGSYYNDTSLNHKIASATGIRKSLINKEIDKVKEYIPPESYSRLIDYINKFNYFNTLDNYNQIIHYLLRINNGVRLNNIMDIEIGLDNRIVEKSHQYFNVDSLIEEIATKRYPRTRIKRIFIQLMAGLTEPMFYELLPHYPAYIRVLGSNEKGFILINKIKEKSSLPIITKFSNYNKFNDPYLNKIISFDKKATDLFFLGLNNSNPFMDMDYYTTPYINKK